MRPCVLAALLVFFAPEPARADDDIAAGMAHYERAEFTLAVSAFDRAMRSEHLTRAELEAILAGRGLANHAAGDVGAAEEDLSTWLSLAPAASFDPTTPPAVRRILERLREEVVPLAVESSVSSASTGFAVDARVNGDIGQLTRAIRIGYLEGDRVHDARGEHVDILSSASVLRYWVEVMGPGGVVIASAGSPERPLEFARPIAGLELGADPTPPPTSDDTALIVGVTVGITVALAALGAVLGFVLAPQPDTTLSGPMRVEMP